MDTLFDLKDSKTILRNSGNDYFINTKTDDNSWTITRLAIRGNVVHLAGIETENEVKLMEQITGQKQVSTPLQVKPTKEQFQAFVSQNGFTNGRTYLRTDSAKQTNVFNQQ